MDDRDIQIGQRIRKFRKDKGLNQSELADAIKSITNNNPQYMAFKQRFVSLCDGNSCRRFVEKILEENK